MLWAHSQSCIITFLFQVVDIELGYGDTLKIFDGNEQGADLIALFSEDDKTPEILFTTGEYTLVQLNTDLTSSGKGFNLTYQRGKNSSCHWEICYYQSVMQHMPLFDNKICFIPNLHLLLKIILFFSSFYT